MRGLEIKRSFFSTVCAVIGEELNGVRTTGMHESFMNLRYGKTYMSLG